MRQRTQVIDALRGHLAEFGMVVAKGPALVDRLLAIALDKENGLPTELRLSPGYPRRRAAVAEQKNIRSGRKRPASAALFNWRR